MSASRQSKDGKRPVAVISGGSRGLGAELIKGFLDRGYCVATLSRSGSRFIETLSKKPGAKSFLWEKVDARNVDALRNFVASVVAHFGRIDVLVNNAGAAREGILATMPLKDISEILETNLTAAICLAQACSRVMLRQASGCIVNVSSINAIRGQTGISVYSASKAGLDGLTRSLARELGPRNIRVNSVAPGYFDSDMVKGMSDADRSRILRRTPLGRLCRVEDIANAIHFLTSDQAAFVTGQTLAVDGGLTC
jgi:3-oxoacyl-[acyl-carrier protein] reductase